MKSALIYVRVSTPGQADHGESLETQEAVCRTYAERNCYQVAAVFREPYTGRKNDRPFLDQMFTRIENGERVDAVIIRLIERFTRGGSPLYTELKQRVQARGVDLIDTAGVIQPRKNALEHLNFEYEWSVESPSRTSETFAAEAAYEERRNILIRTVQQEICLVQQGYRTRPAPIGFQNKKIEDSEGKKKTILVPDSKEAPWIQEIYRLRAEGLLSDDTICDQVNALGFRTRQRKKRDPLTRRVVGTTGNKPLTNKMLGRIVRRTENCGVILEKWTHDKPIRAPYPGLVSIESFNRANRGTIEIVEHRDGSLSVRRDTKPKRHYLNHNPTYPYRFVVRCPECGGPFKGSASRGRHGKHYPGYHCSRGHRYIRIPQPKLDETVQAFVEGLRIKKESLPLLEAAARDVWKRKHHDSKRNEQLRQKTAVERRQKQELLLEQYTQTDSSVLKRLLEEKIEELDSEISPIVEEKEPNLEDYLQRLRSLVEHPARLLLNADNQRIMRQIWRFVFDELPTYETLCGGTPEMTALLELYREPKLGKNQLVARLSSKWNLFVKQVRDGCKLPLEIFQVSGSSSAM